MKYLSILLALLLFVACEPANNDTQQPNTPEINEGENEGENGGDNGEDNGEDNGDEDNGEDDETIATIHTFTEFNTSAHVIILETNGLRNDYVTFYDTQTGYALYIDFYSPIENEYLPDGTYSLSDGSSMTLDKQYTYFTDVEIPQGYLDYIQAEVSNRFTISELILDQNYWKILFGAS